MWTDARVDLLKKLWSDGLSSGQISLKFKSPNLPAELRHDVSRNSVIGKVDRLGLAKRSPTVETKPGRRPRKRAALTIPKFLGSDQSPLASSPANGMQRARGKKRAAASALQPSIAEVGAVDTYVPRKSEIVIPEGQRKTLLELTEETCRFPLGDFDGPTEFFCGAAPFPGQVYCLAHCKVCFTSPPPRLDVRPVPR